ncbi:MAG: hypothetical protein FWD47_15745, partial [Treponema sp.]|nr:hypothetical protein [Treponema sp.]
KLLLFSYFSSSLNYNNIVKYIFCQYFIIKLTHISHNVLVVYDGLATRISETVGFAGLPNCGGDKTA